jgi:hypothetical protein
VKSSHQVVEITDLYDSTLNVTNEYKVESPDTEMNIEVIPTPPLVTEENLCFSLRNVQNKMERVDEKAMAVAKKRGIEGTPKNPNSFDTLSNPDLILRAVKMGVNIPDVDFASIDILRELEKCRNMETLNDKCTQPDPGGETMILTNAKGDQTPLSMNWGDENEIDDEKITVVRSRKKKERKANVIMARPITRSQKGRVSLHNETGNSTLLPSRVTRKGVP